MKKIILQLVLVVLAFMVEIAAAAPNLSFSPAPLTSSTNTVLTIESGWQELIQIFPSSDGGFNVNVVTNGNIVNLDVVGADGIFFFPDRFTHIVSLGQLQPGSYQLRLRFRDTPTQVGVPGVLNPRIRATANFIVEPGPILVTQVPTLSSGASILLTLLVLGLGMFAARRQ